jgi:hypothetical protein
MLTFLVDFATIYVDFYRLYSSTFPNFLLFCNVELKRYSTVQWFFTLDPTSNHRQVKMLLLGYKILRICSTEQGETTASTDFQQIAKKATDAHLVYWDEAVARNVARTVCPDFAAAGDDKSSIPAMF